MSFNTKKFKILTRAHAQRRVCVKWITSVTCSTDRKQNGWALLNTFVSGNSSGKETSVSVSSPLSWTAPRPTWCLVGPPLLSYVDKMGVTEKEVRELGHLPGPHLEFFQLELWATTELPPGFHSKWEQNKTVGPLPRHWLFYSAHPHGLCGNQAHVKFQNTWYTWHFWQNYPTRKVQYLCLHLWLCGFWHQSILLSIFSRICRH